MTRKRKRTFPDDTPSVVAAAPNARPTKLVKTDAHPNIEHPLLLLYYPRVCTLREWALARLPATSRLRRRKLASEGLQTGTGEDERALGDPKRALGHLLDTTFVAEPCADGTVGADPRTESEAAVRWYKYERFWRRGDDFALLDGRFKELPFRQGRVVDFIIWFLFRNQQSIKQGSWPKHLLCDGYRRSSGCSRGTTIPGLSEIYCNQRVRTMKKEPWPQLLQLLGEEGQRIMIDLLLDCSIFTAVRAGNGNLYQLSGEPISEIKKIAPRAADAKKGRLESVGEPRAEHSLSDITFVRSRILYAEAAHSVVPSGLGRMHALNRYPYVMPPSPANKAQNVQVTTGSKVHTNTVRVMMYIFPRQFRLQNAFTSVPNPQKTTQKFQDYTLREKEILVKFPAGDSTLKPLQSCIPKRLNGPVIQLVERLQILHRRCSYTELLQYYCPVHERIESLMKNHSESFSTISPLQDSSPTDLATLGSQVSAFVRAVLAKIVPKALLGEHNIHILLHKVDHFIRRRRLESMTLHEVLQGMKFSGVGWLATPSLRAHKASRTDTQKRTELFAELVYYLLDSVVVPLVRSNFYVTESGAHCHRLLYFRHDVWRFLSEPAKAALKADMFEEVRPRPTGIYDALGIQDSTDIERLGYSHMRLLPKKRGIRPIINLSRRMPAGAATTKVLRPSINSVLAPVDRMLQLEREQHPGRLGSAMFSVSDMYTRIKGFKARYPSSTPLPRFYFAKVDVKAAFDTIPQEAVIALMRTIPTHQHYQTLRHAQVSPLGNGGVVAHRWLQDMRPAGEVVPFVELLEGTGKLAADAACNTAFVDKVVHADHDRDALLALLEAHVGGNIVRIDKKLYHQRRGIPQGSVLSSALCNYFYADLEAQHLGFLWESGDGDCLLMRLIDDFLLITTNRTKAVRFVKAMHRGFPDYGVDVSIKKTLVNFALEINGVKIASVEKEHWFPYCGTLIDPATLGLAKSWENVKNPQVFDSLTVEFSRHPGRTFRQKVISAFKIYSHAMFFDTAHNGHHTVAANTARAAAQTAVWLWAYMRCLTSAKRPRQSLVVGGLAALADAAFHLIAGRARHARYPGYECNLRRTSVAWLVFAACHRVLTVRQTGYAEVLAWLEAQMASLERRKEVDMAALEKAVTEIKGMV